MGGGPFFPDRPRVDSTQEYLDVPRSNKSYENLSAVVDIGRFVSFNSFYRSIFHRLNR